MNATKPRYARHLAIVTALAYCAHLLLGSAGYSSAESADGTALIMLALLAILTGLTAASKKDDEPGFVSAARMLVVAGTAAAACIGASHASGHVWLFLVGFFVAIPYMVYALRKEIDDHLSLSFLLFASLVQFGVTYYIVN